MPNREFGTRAGRGGGGLGRGRYISAGTPAVTLGGLGMIGGLALFNGEGGSVGY